MHTCSHAQNMRSCSCHNKNSAHRHHNFKTCTPVTNFCSSKMRAAIARVQAKVDARNNGVGPADAAGVGQADAPGGVGQIRAKRGRAKRGSFAILMYNGILCDCYCRLSERGRVASCLDSMRASVMVALHHDCLAKRERTYG